MADEGICDCYGGRILGCRLAMSKWCRSRCLRVYEEEEERCQGGTTPKDGDVFLDRSCSRGPETKLSRTALDQDDLWSIVR